jgi:hypothetical protein
MGERLEALWRLPIAVIAWIILEVWGWFFIIVLVLHWLLTLITGERNSSLATIANHYVSYAYRVLRYLGLATNERPFPFADYRDPIEPVRMRHVVMRVKKK